MSSVSATRNETWNQSDFTFLLIDPTITTTHLACVSIGIPLNLFAATVIVCFKRFHRNRNVQMVAVFLSDLFILVAHAIELYAFHGHSETARNVFAIILGLPYASLFMNLFLNLMDRYLFLSYPAWYKQNVTVGFIVSMQMGCFAFLCVALKGPYIFSSFSFHPEVSIFDYNLFSLMSFTMLMLCFGALVTTCLKTKQYLAIPQRDPSLRNVAIVQQVLKRSAVVSVHYQAADREEYSTILAMKKENSQAKHFVRIGNHSVSRLELEATRTVSTTVALLLLCCLPGLVIMLLSAECLKNSAKLGDCESALWRIAYAKELLLLYTVFQPIFFIVRSQDFVAFLQCRMSI